MAAQAGLCLAGSETPEDTFCRVVAHLYGCLFFFLPVLSISFSLGPSFYGWISLEQEVLNSRTMCLPDLNSLFFISIYFYVFKFYEKYTSDTHIFEIIIYMYINCQEIELG